MRFHPLLKLARLICAFPLCIGTSQFNTPTHHCPGFLSLFPFLDDVLFPTAFAARPIVQSPCSLPLTLQFLPLSRSGLIPAFLLAFHTPTPRTSDWNKNDHSRSRDGFSFSRAKSRGVVFSSLPVPVLSHLHSPGLTPTLLFGCSFTALSRAESPSCCF